MEIKNTINKINITKIAISSKENSLDGRLDARFGRAAGFIIFDVVTGDYEYFDNGASQVINQGAGVKTASSLVKKRCTRSFNRIYWP